MRHGKSRLRLVATLLIAVVALVAAALAGGQQPKGAPFSTEIMKLKEGLYVIPGYDGAATGDRKSTRLNSSHIQKSRMPSSA